ncbi:MAG: amidohydrolase [Candidatus Aminicenantales bacterium]
MNNRAVLWTVIIIIAASALMMVALVSCGGGVPMADKILVNGKIWTVDPGRPWAEAVAVRDHKILAVGTTFDIRKTAGRTTEIIDLKNAFVLPGFIDSHVHFINGGRSLTSVQLREARSKEEFVQRIAAKARDLPKGEWILNGEWDHTQFDPVELPRREWIDAVTPDHPVCVNRLDGHMILANSLALKLGGVTKNTPVPAGGEIVKDSATGEPTGILKDAAMDLVFRRMPDPTPAQTMRAAEAAMAYAAERGVTSVHDVSGEAGFDVYQELLKNRKLTTRISFYVPVTEVDLVLRMKLRTSFGNDMLAFAGLKGFSDGSLGSATAYFFEPYADDPKARGLLNEQMFPEGLMEKRVLAADRGGLQIAIHAIGDRANAIVLDIFEKAERENGDRDRRFRIEHAQHLRPADIVRFGKLKVIASVQPYHLIDDGRWAEKKIGPERAKTTYPFKSLLDNGVTLVCGSDWPVAPMDPIMGLYAAVTRRTLDEKNPGGWIPEQKITLGEAIKGFTINGAFAQFAEKIKGSIEPGKLADFVVLDRNLFAVKPEEIRDARVVMTIVNGEIVYGRRI